VHLPPAAGEARPSRPPARFRWRRRSFETVAATGPERIAPEWWLDEPDWRTGVRDYWQVEVSGGERLWLYYAHGAALSPGWFCQGRFD
jgi:protein ImuB